eukprot:10938326-Alexandrium_andersonii.AAC.1
MPGAHCPFPAADMPCSKEGLAPWLRPRKATFQSVLQCEEGAFAQPLVPPQSGARGCPAGAL